MTDLPDFTPPQEIPITTRGHVIQIMMMPSGLSGPDGVIKSNLSIANGPVRLNVPTEAFNFLVPDLPCIVTLSIIQVRPADPPILAPSSKLILPN